MTAPQRSATGRQRVKRLVMAIAVVTLTASSIGVVAGPAQARTPGANGRIVFARYYPSSDSSFTYTANADGSDQTRLLPGYESSSPHWSPDGTQVAVTSGLGAPCPPTCTGNTVIINPSTGQQRVLASQGFPAVSTFCSIWSPDASHFLC